MPVTLDATATTAEGVAFVTVRVSNTEPVARRVRLANRLDGVVLPPRRHGTPEPGWSDDGYAGVVAGGDDLAVGYACVPNRDGRTAEATAIDADPPVELVSVGAPDASDADHVADAATTLGAARPPADAVGGDADFDGDGGGAPPDPFGTEPAPAAPAPAPTPTVADASGSRTDPDAPPPAVVRYLDAVETRIERAEALEDGTVAEATASLSTGIDPGGIEDLLATDAEALSAVAGRASALADRARGVEVPAEAMERLA
ncbi:hypothetical protein Hbl1158_02150 [Halobaculum sp. CBA1158]|uniref:DUF7857 domain-containing protein n=1 Tax=Halobaculum sp. CBA1158 TaxID=2904243 RepID=UPI001F214C49|nr:hypothetical protein [Halobaculum sp. CBA1158]UIP00194.1 hypothetical protein Hbl1158_02150 [Halobaculum sp. CBA1158]